ncbi:MAG: DNA primase large subunit PriL [Candidatus Bathyarchaeia archaeon]
MSSIVEVAKYPFTGKAAERVKEIEFRTDELMAPQFSSVLERAKERIEQAIRKVEIQGWGQKDEIELLSFPAAIFMVSILKNDRLTRRYALAEAKRAYQYLRGDDLNVLKEIAREFSWDLLELDESPIRLGVHFADYLKNSVWIKESRWRLINRRVEGGRVILTRDECARLLQEEIRRKIEDKVNKNIQIPFREEIKPVLDKFERLCNEILSSEPLYVSGGEVSLAAFPPCIKALYGDLEAGRSISHIGRFTLTSFLVNIGVSQDEVLKLFRSASDFDLEKTRYQVEHISGFRGAGRKYKPPRCATLKTHGLCHNPDELCRNIRHPLFYYRRKKGFLVQREKIGS